MQAATKRHINSGREYDYLFPAAMNKDKTVLENATLDDTIAFIHKVVGKTLSHTQQLAQTLQAPTVYETCRNIWNFVYRNVAYKNDMGELGAKGGHKKKKKGFFKKLINKINKINPATVILRNGFLADMKLNLFKVASRIKYASLSPKEATKRGIIPGKYQKLVKVKEKLESIFETAGRNPNNLKKAILKGKGNKNKEVALNGIGFLDGDMSVLHMDTNTPLAQLLGPDIYYDENVRGMEA